MKSLFLWIATVLGTVQGHPYFKVNIGLGIIGVISDGGGGPGGRNPCNGQDECGNNVGGAIPGVDVRLVVGDKGQCAGQGNGNVECGNGVSETTPVNKEYLQNVKTVGDDCDNEGNRARGGSIDGKNEMGSGGVVAIDGNARSGVGFVDPNIRSGVGVVDTNVRSGVGVADANSRSGEVVGANNPIGATRISVKIGGNDFNPQRDVSTFGRNGESRGAGNPGNLEEFVPEKVELARKIEDPGKLGEMNNGIDVLSNESILARQTNSPGVHERVESPIGVDRKVEKYLKSDIGTNNGMLGENVPIRVENGRGNGKVGKVEDIVVNGNNSTNNTRMPSENGQGMTQQNGSDMKLKKYGEQQGNVNNFRNNSSNVSSPSGLYKPVKYANNWIGKDDVVKIPGYLGKAENSVANRLNVSHNAGTQDGHFFGRHGGKDEYTKSFGNARVPVDSGKDSSNLGKNSISVTSFPGDHGNVADSRSGNDVKKSEVAENDLNSGNNTSNNGNVLTRLDSAPGKGDIKKEVKIANERTGENPGRVEDGKIQKVLNNPSIPTVKNGTYVVNESGRVEKAGKSGKMEHFERPENDVNDGRDYLYNRKSLSGKATTVRANEHVKIEKSGNDSIVEIYERAKENNSLTHGSNSNGKSIEHNDDRIDKKENSPRKKGTSEYGLLQSNNPSKYIHTTTFKAIKRGSKNLKNMPSISAVEETMPTTERQMRTISVYRE